MVKERGIRDSGVSRGVYPYLPMAKNAPWSIFFGGGDQKFNIKLNIQKCEFCAQI